jgi:hypothetical protein
MEAVSYLGNGGTHLVSAITAQAQGVRRCPLFCCNACVKMPHTFPECVGVSPQANANQVDFPCVQAVAGNEPALRQAALQATGLWSLMVYLQGSAAGEKKLEGFSLQALNARRLWRTTLVHAVVPDVEAFCSYLRLRSHTGWCTSSTP